MNYHSSIKRAWLLSVVAVILSCAVVCLGWYIAQLQSSRTERIAATSQELTKQLSAAHIHATVVETKDERAQIEKYIQPDVVSIVESIEQLGVVVGTPVQVGNTVPETISISATQNASAYSFSVQSQGTFAQMTRVVSLLESLALPSAVKQLDLQGVTEKGNTIWHLSARVRVLAISNTPS